MADVTITGLRVAPVVGVRIPTTWRAYCMTPNGFLLNDASHTAVAESSPYNNGNYYKSGALTSDGAGYIASDFTLPSTTDSPDKPNEARWGLFVFDQSDNPRVMYPVAGLASFALSTDTPQNAEDIVEYNLGSLPTLTPHDVHITGNLDVDGNVSGDSFTGSAAGLHDFPGGATLVNNAIVAAGSAGINADSDGNGVGEAYLAVNSVTKFKANQDGADVEATVPVKLKSYATGSLPAEREAWLTYDSTRKRPVYGNGSSWISLGDPYANVKMYGLKDDGSTDNAAALQTLIDNIVSAGDDGTIIFFPYEGNNEYIFSGGLQDTSASNSQIVLPKVSTQFSLKFLGGGMVSRLGGTIEKAGVILKTTFNSSAGAFFGCKLSTSTDPDDATDAGLNTSKLNVDWENLTFSAPANPKLTMLDLSYVKHPVGNNLRFGTGEIYDAVAVEPTTATSAAIKMPKNYVPSHTDFRGVVILGFYNGIFWREFTHMEHVVIANCKRAFYVQDAVGWSSGRSMFVADCPHVVVVDPAATKHTFEEFNVKIERPGAGWFAAVDEIDDPNSALYGALRYYQGGTSHSLILTSGSGKNLDYQDAGYTADWTNYTPTITTSSGTITTLGTVTGQWKAGKRGQILVRLRISITTNGTGAGQLNASLPFTSDNGKMAWAGIDEGMRSINGFVDANSPTVQINARDGSYIGADAKTLIVSGWYSI